MQRTRSVSKVSNICVNVSQSCQIWPPGGSTCTTYKFSIGFNLGHQVSPLVIFKQKTNPQMNKEGQKTRCVIFCLFWKGLLLIAHCIALIQLSAFCLPSIYFDSHQQIKFKVKQINICQKISSDIKTHSCLSIDQIGYFVKMPSSVHSVNC